MPVCRGGLVLTTALLAAPVLWRTLTAVGRQAEDGAPLRTEDALTAVVAAAALLALLWLVLGVLLGLFVLVPGVVGRGAGRLAEVVTPVLVRRTVGALLGVGLAAGVAPGAAVAAPVPALVVAPRPLPDPGFAPLPDPAWAPSSRPPTRITPVTSPPAPAATVTTPAPASGGSPTAAPGASWVTPPPLVRPQPDVRVLSPAPRARPPGEGREEVVVRRGDSLWSIAARHLGGDATDAEVARAWPAWFEANRDVIGEDPDLLRPGQLLRPPEGVGS